MRYVREMTETVYNVLKQVETNTYPLVATEGTSLPFVVFERTGMYDQPTKDGGDTEFSFDVRIVTATYFDGLTLADNIRNELRHNLQARLTGASEEYTADGYLQTLNFSF